MSTAGLRIAIKAINQFGDACKVANRSMEYFGRMLLYARVAPVYASVHGGVLPGSTRTSRLRKKRIDAVLRWWSGWNPSKSPQDAP
jgi:hypothetical protein